MYGRTTPGGNLWEPVLQGGAFTFTGVVMNLALVITHVLYLVLAYVGATSTKLVFVNNQYMDQGDRF